jgi:hypothetical protein
VDARRGVGSTAGGVGAGGAAPEIVAHGRVTEGPLPKARGRTQLRIHLHQRNRRLKNTHTHTRTHSQPRGPRSWPSGARVQHPRACPKRRPSNPRDLPGATACAAPSPQAARPAPRTAAMPASNPALWGEPAPAAAHRQRPAAKQPQQHAETFGGIFFSRGQVPGAETPVGNTTAPLPPSNVGAGHRAGRGAGAPPYGGSVVLCVRRRVRAAGAVGAGTVGQASGVGGGGSRQIGDSSNDGGRSTAKWWCGLWAVCIASTLDPILVSITCSALVLGWLVGLCEVRCPCLFVP